MIKKLLALMLVLNFAVASEVLPTVELKGDNGGRLNGKSWSSSEIQGKVFVLFYVDPDEKDMNEHVGQALKKANFSRDVYSSIAVINMAATWLPNFALESALKKKQETYPDTVYVKDLDKVLVKKWNLKDDSSNILVFNKNGQMVYKVSGKASQKQLDEVLAKVRENLNL